MSEKWRMLHFTHFLGHLLLFSHQSLDNRNHQQPPRGAAAVVNTNKMSQHRESMSGYQKYSYSCQTASRKIIETMFQANVAFFIELGFH